MSERRFVVPGRALEGSAAEVFAGAPNDLLVSSAVVESHGGYDHVRIWNRGAMSGALVLQLGDGELLMQQLGLEENP